MWARERDMDSYLNRLLVDSLSREAVIPTYSFPVHSLHLEIVTERGKRTEENERALQLDRDAAMAIAEYAPGAEVVAGGRIWKSAGIARTSRLGQKDVWLDRGFHRICPVCQHAEKHDDWEKFESNCPQCGNTLPKLQRQYIEPVGFLTSRAEREGKDPGVSRLRERPVDEARLLTKPRPEEYEASDVDMVTHYFAPAIGADDAPKGQMFIVNRGPNGAGYLWCSRCEYAEPAPKEAAWGRQEISIRHNNPRTGELCPSESFGKPLDLAHIFETDLRCIRIDPDERKS